MHSVHRGSVYLGHNHVKEGEPTASSQQPSGIGKESSRFLHKRDSFNLYFFEKEF